MAIDLAAFLLESNKIEGIVGVKPMEFAVAERFLRERELSVDAVSAYVRATAPDAVLRDRHGLDVRVGGYCPPPGGPLIATVLTALLAAVNQGQLAPYEAHCRYESLHPYLDGNGRSGRLIWLWQMLRDGRSPRLGFLHTWYYQSLAALPERGR